jgi:tetratricopeptide (TPR) repeat protein
MAMATAGQMRVWKSSDALFTHAISVTRNNRIAYNNLGSDTYNHKDYAAAERYLTAAIRISPNYIDALRNLGLTFEATKRYREAIPLFSKIIARQPHNVDVLEELARSLSIVGDTSQALAHIRKAVSLKPDLSNLHTTLGEIEERAGNFQAAERAFQMACRLDTADATPRFRLGILLARLHDYEKALGQLGSTTHPDDKPKAFADAGKILAESNDTAEAAVLYNAALAMDSSLVNALTGLGKIRVFQWRFEEARALFEKSLHYNPRNADTYCRLGDIAFAEKQIDNAVRWYRKSVEIDPQHPIAQLHLSLALRAQ